MSARIEVYRDAARKWRFRVVAGNGEIVAVSEAYNTKNSACLGVKAMTTAVVETMTDSTETLVSFTVIDN